MSVIIANGTAEVRENKPEKKPKEKKAEEEKAEK